MANSYQQYVRHDVMMATPMDLVVMLYTGCIKRLRLSQMAISKNDNETANNNLQKAQDIVVELIAGLDLQYGIARELMAIYEFVHRQIIRINASKDASMIDPVVEIMSNLRDAWLQVQKENKSTAQIEYESE